MLILHNDTYIEDHAKHWDVCIGRIVHLLHKLLTNILFFVKRYTEAQCQTIKLGLPQFFIYFMNEWQGMNEYCVNTE